MTDYIDRLNDINRLKSGLKFCEENLAKANYMLDHMEYDTDVRATENDFITLRAVAQWAINALNYEINDLTEKNQKK